MTQNGTQNRQLTLASRPAGAPGKDNFHLKLDSVPQIEEGQLLLRTVYLSLDPYMRGRMSDAKSYAEPVAIGEVMVGGTVNRVVASRHPDYQAGDWVVSYTVGWQDYGVSDGSMLFKLNPEHGPVSHALGVLGMPGFTAYMGLKDIGQPEPGETLVVAAATGPVGATVAQIGKIMGCRVVAIAGGEQKRQHLEAMGVDVALDHRDPDFAQKLAEACPKGIDIYFENVGGAVFRAVLPLLNFRARIPLCGTVSGYNAVDLPEGPDHLDMAWSILQTRRVKVQGFIIFDDYGHRYEEFAEEMARWVAEGKIEYLEQIIDGLEAAPEGLRDLLEGKNFGKLVVRVGPDELA
ncbi:NADP-dependent oxidoreductase [Marinobacter daepoensis]|uniref:NADP-dependent oxidoreductase n=1 Tax=Marinobacter daepoensis TaxID=262077 RepID=A0ABS3BC08_9GAMM|nr:NADP-dependent oxidoreductase [Marinobacter daepoensis]MBN7769381.1 NADP-dependent oxidoreductase [Marinobacter daepoensis]MBY6078071.1 NADP-dependent oxidoreductase [Marinobacter daepoensis]